jgi:hypothetical protein
MARLFGASAPAAKPKQQFTGPAKDAAQKEQEGGRLRAQLAAQIRSLRAKLNPQLLKIGEKLAKKGPAVTDQERATLAIELFLAQKQDGGDFAAKLKAKIEERRRREH